MSAAETTPSLATARRGPRSLLIAGVLTVVLGVAAVLVAHVLAPAGGTLQLAWESAGGDAGATALIYAGDLGAYALGAGAAAMAIALAWRVALSLVKRP